MGRCCNIAELHLMIGLPGSGKTTYAKKFRNYGAMASIVDFDEIFKKSKTKEEIEDRACRSFQYNYVFLDGLFTTQKDYEYILSLYLTNSFYQVNNVIIDYWIPDVEACLYNDKGRRTVKSTYSIKNIKIQEPDIKRLSQIFNKNIKIVKHKVVRRPIYLDFASHYNIELDEDGCFESDSWCLGGVGHSWTGEIYRIDAESPCSFTQFDDLLTEICPNITFLQYKKLWNHTVRKGDRSSCDYYSDTREGYYSCNVERLYELLKEMGYIKDM